MAIGGGADGGRYGSGRSGRRGGFEEVGLKERVEWEKRDRRPSRSGVGSWQIINGLI